MEPSHPKRWWQFLLKPMIGIPLALILLGVAAPLMFRNYRLAAVPDIGDPFDVEAFSHVDIDPNNNAFELYKPAVERFDATTAGSNLKESEVESAVAKGWRAATEEVRRLLGDNRE